MGLSKINKNSTLLTNRTFCVIQEHLQTSRIFYHQKDTLAFQIATFSYIFVYWWLLNQWISLTCGISSCHVKCKNFESCSLVFFPLPLKHLSFAKLSSVSFKDSRTPSTAASVTWVMAAMPQKSVFIDWLGLWCQYGNLPTWKGPAVLIQLNTARKRAAKGNMH